MSNVGLREDSSGFQVFHLSLFFSFSALLWLMLWLGINTGPWTLKRTPTTSIALLHYIRTLFPFLVLSISLVLSLAQKGAEIKVLSGPVKLWLAYGLIGLGACLVASPRPFSGAYWAICYLSVFGGVNSFLQGHDPLERAVVLNYLTWIITTVFLVILIFTARDALLVDNRTGMTGYGIVQRVGTVGDMAMSRSSGMARFAAVPGVACFVLFWQSKGIIRLLWAGIFFMSAALVYLMQSRGAILGLAFAVFFIMLFMGTKSRRLGAVFLLLLGLAVYTHVIPDREIEQVTEHITRGQSVEELQTMTGRTRAWEKGWEKVLESPLWGWGPQADRYLIKEHVHNTYMYALLSAGFLGAAAFVGGLAWVWFLFLRAVRERTAERFGHRFFLLQAGGILAFFTVRSIPEVCGAMFGVDLMVMLPAIAYLVVLDQKGKEKKEAVEE